MTVPVLFLTCIIIGCLGFGLSLFLMFNLARELERQVKDVETKIKLLDGDDDGR